MHVEQNPQGPDELTMRFLALRDAPTGIVLPSGARIRAAGTMRRRRRTMVSVTSAALAAAAVAFLVTNPSDRRQAVPPPPPATQVPVTTTTSTTARLVMKPAGDPDVIRPRGQVNAALFLPGSAWRKVEPGKGAVRWSDNVNEDWGMYDGGSVAVQVCDEGFAPTGEVGRVGIEIIKKDAIEIVGLQRVRVAAGPAAARALLEQVLEDLATCPDRARAASADKFSAWGDITDVAVEEFEDGTGDDTRVFRLTKRFVKWHPDDLWVGVGVSGNRFTVLGVDAPSAEGDDVAELLTAALQRLEAVP